VRYYLQGSTTKLANDKVVSGQTMGASVTENAVSITDYTAVAPTRVTATLNATGNVFTFYYTAAGGSGGGGGGSQTTPPTTTATPPSPTPTVTPPPDGGGVKSPQEWAIVNLILSLTGLISVIAVSIYVLMQKNSKNEQQSQTQQLQTNTSTAQNTATYPNSKQDSRVEERKYHEQSLRVWLFTALAMGVLGVILFLFTEDMRNDMVFVDRWTVVNVVVFVVEMIALCFVFKHKNACNDSNNSMDVGVT